MLFDWRYVLLKTILWSFSAVYLLAIFSFIFFSWGKSWKEKLDMIWRHKIRAVIALVLFIPFLVISWAHLYGAFFTNAMPATEGGEKYARKHMEETLEKQRLFCSGLSPNQCDIKLSRMQRNGYTTELQYQDAVKRKCQDVTEDECNKRLYQSDKP